MPSNDLYLVVLPMVHLAISQYGLTEQVITMLPIRSIATEFAPDEVDSVIFMMESRANEYLTGGNVMNYTFTKEPTSRGVIVKVTQNVR